MIHAALVLIRSFWAYGILTLKCQSKLQPMTNSATSFLILETNKVILMKYHALFAILKKQQNLKLSCAANYRWRFMG